MPDYLEVKLRAEAKRKGIPSERVDTYVYDKMSRRRGWNEAELKEYISKSKEVQNA